jgi:hypothetical protein
MLYLIYIKKKSHFSNPQPSLSDDGEYDVDGAG